MKNLLSTLFEKRGIKDVTELSKEEKTIFDNYQRILSKEKIEIEDIQRFLESQIASIELKWRGLDYDGAKLIPYHTCYKALLQVINSPLAERENLERYLTQLINQ